MAEDIASITPFEPLEAVEKELCTQLSNAQASHPRSIAVTARPGTNPSVRSAFLQWFLLEELPAKQLPIIMIELRDVTVRGMLNLSGASLRVTPRFVNCTFEDDINLNDVTGIGIELISGSAKRIFADRLTTEGAVRISAVSEGETKESPRIIRLRLCGAKVRGNLDLRGCHLIGESTDPLRSIPPVFADGLVVEGSALLSDGFTASGEVRLNGCKILRNLDFSGATLRNWNGYSLSAAGANISGTVYLCAKKRWSTYADGRPFTPASFISEGTLRFAGATVEGHFDCSGGTFTATAFQHPDSITTKPTNQDQLDAIHADGLKVGGDVSLSDDSEVEFSAHGVVKLVSVEIGGDLYLEGKFDFPGEEPVAADGIIVAGTTFMEGLHTNGLLSFVQADLKQGLYVDEASFDTRGICHKWSEEDPELGGPACGIFAPDATVGGTFIWKNVKKISNSNNRNISFWLYLLGSTVTTVEDDENSWQQLDRFEVTGCEYSNIKDLTSEISWRLAVLDREYAIRNGSFFHNFGFACLLLWRAFQRSWLWRVFQFGCGLSAPNRTSIEEARERFKPLPYIQFANVLRRAGHERAASKVLVRLERNRTRYSDFGVWRQLGQMELGLDPSIWLLALSASGVDFAVGSRQRYIF